MISLRTSLSFDKDLSKFVLYFSRVFDSVTYFRNWSSSFWNDIKIDLFLFVNQFNSLKQTKSSVFRSRLLDTVVKTYLYLESLDCDVFQGKDVPGSTEVSRRFSEFIDHSRILRISLDTLGTLRKKLSGKLKTLVTVRACPNVARSQRRSSDTSFSTTFHVPHSFSKSNLPNSRIIQSLIVKNFVNAPIVILKHDHLLKNRPRISVITLPLITLTVMIVSTCNDTVIFWSSPICPCRPLLSTLRIHFYHCLLRCHPRRLSPPSKFP